MYPMPTIPLRIERDRNGIWFYNDNKPWPTSCTCVIGPNVSGGVTMTADFIKNLGIKAFIRGNKTFNPKLRKWE